MVNSIEMKSVSLSNSKVFQVLFALSVILLYLFSTGSFAYADGGVSSGIDSILRSSTLEGDGETRATVAGYLHKPISFIITIAGFLIITFSFLKIVLTLLYLTFPTIFDKIDAHQKTSMQINLREAKPADMISYVFALIMPNVKSLTDYANEDNQLDLTPVDYLKKRLPSIIFFILIGAMIFDGQARNFIAKAADVGMLFGSIVEEHDTVGAVKTFVGASGKYTYAYDGATQEGKNRNRIKDKVDSTLRGINPNMKGDEFNTAVGQMTEGVVKKVEADIIDAGKRVGIAKFEEIVSFKISASITTIKPASPESKTKGSGVLVLDITTLSSKNAATILQTKTKNKWLVISYSQIVDADNRNVLFEKPVTPK